jgi:hypothetical protein
VSVCPMVSTSSSGVIDDINSTLSLL